MKLGIHILFLLWRNKVEYVSCGCVSYDYVEESTSFIQSVKSFNPKRMMYFAKCFFYTYWNDHVIFIFQFSNVIYYICWVVYVELSLYPRNELVVVWLLIQPFYSLLVCSYFLSLPDSNLVDYVFLEMHPFLLGYVIFWHIIGLSYNPTYFCSTSCSVSSFLSKVFWLSPAKGLSILSFQWTTSYFHWSFPVAFLLSYFCADLHSFFLLL